MVNDYQKILLYIRNNALKSKSASSLSAATNRSLDKISISKSKIKENIVNKKDYNQNSSSNSSSNCSLNGENESRSGVKKRKTFLNQNSEVSFAI